MIFDLRLQYFGYDCVRWLLNWGYYIRADGIFSVVYLNWLAVLSTEGRKTFKAVPPCVSGSRLRVALCFSWCCMVVEPEYSPIRWTRRFCRVLRNRTSVSKQLKRVPIFEHSCSPPEICGIIYLHEECGCAMSVYVVSLASGCIAEYPNLRTVHGKSSL